MIQVYIHLLVVIVAVITLLQALGANCARVQISMNMIPQLDFAVRI